MNNNLFTNRAASMGDLSVQQTFGHFPKEPKKKAGNRLTLKMIAPQYSSQSYESRTSAANIMNAHLIMMEIMMANVIQKYIHDISSELKERNMMRHNLKRRINEMETISYSLMEGSNLQDRIQIEEFAKDIHPSLTDSYYEDKGSYTQKIQAAFWLHFKKAFEDIDNYTAGMFDRSGVKNISLATNAEMVILLADSAIAFYGWIEHEIKNMLRGIRKFERVKSMRYEKLLGAARDLLREVAGNKPIDPQDFENLQNLAEVYRNGISGSEMMDLTQNCAVSLRMEFTEYVLAQIYTRLKNANMTITDYRVLLLRMGTKDEVRRLLAEIKAIEIQEEEGEELNMFDIMDQLPDSNSESQSAIGDFRRLSLDGKVRMNLGGTKEVMQRRLRREVYRNGGELTEITLRYLYLVFGTKKAVNDYLTETGPDVMARTMRKLKRITAEQLRLKTEKWHAINLMYGVKRVMVRFGYTLERLSQETGISRSLMKEMEQIGDASRCANIEKPLVNMARRMGRALDVDAQYMLFASLKATDEDTPMPEAYLEVFKEMKDKYNGKNTQEDGKEEKENS